MRNLSVSHSLATFPDRGGKKGAALRQTAVQNPSVTACAVPAPPSSGALGKEDKFLLYGQHADAAALPRPPLLGEVALRSKDGRVVQRRSLAVRQTPLQRGAFFMRILLPKVPNCGTRRKFWKNFGQNTEKFSQFCPLWPMRSRGAVWYP